MENKVADDKTQKHKGSMRIIRNVYLYLVTLIGLITFIFGAVGIINNVLQHYVFQVDQNYNAYIYPSTRGGQCAMSYPDPTDTEGKRMIAPTTQEVADCQKAEAEQNKRMNDSSFARDLSVALAQIAIGLPVWLFHWGIIQKEYRRKEEEENEKA